MTGQVRAEILPLPVHHACPLGQGCVCQDWDNFKTHSKVLCGLAAVLTAPLDEF